MDSLNFRDELAFSPVNVPRAALCFAREIAYPGLDVRGYLDRMAGLSEQAEQVVQPAGPVSERVASLTAFLFQRLSFRGNLVEYMDPRNSYINEVLDRRKGLPITLSVIFVDMAERLGIPAYGIGLPGHFIVGVTNPPQDIYLDPFHGGELLSLEDCAELVQRSTGYQGPFQVEWLEPSSSRETLARMLNNLRGVYTRQQAWDAALNVVEHLRVVQPDHAQHLRDLGLLHARRGSLRLAVSFLERYLTAAPDAPDAESVTRAAQVLARELAQLN